MIRYIICNAENVVMGEGSCVAEDLHLKAKDGQYAVVIGHDVEVIRGQRYIGGQLLDALPDPEKKIRAIRQQRLEFLKDSDWTQLPDAPLTEAEKATWRVYRQSLRDLPQQVENINNIPWPIPPS